MKTIQKFQCEVCHTEYAKKEDCQNCEEGHKKVEGICSTRYVSIRQNGSGYPVSVDIEFDNGEVITYKR